MENRLNQAKEILRKYHQEHIINLIEKVEETKKEEIIDQVLKINFDSLMELYENTKKIPEIEEKEITHIKYIDKYKLTEETRKEYDNLGEDIIRKNQYAVVTMAGGQGTRLGHEGPKGTFLIDVEPTPKYLFQILAEGLIKANKTYGVTLPWYIMTSTENDKETTSFFEEHEYFGYPKEKVKFFKQGNLPLISTEGKLFVDEEHNIKEAADGNGCIYVAMKNSGILDDMKRRGIEWIFIGAVDNVLLNMVDPTLIGLTIKEGNLVASKSVAKKEPKERVGVFCKKNQVPTVIEYTELPEEMAEEVDEDGELLYGEAHIMCNLFHIEALEKISNQKLPYHSAFKKANHLNEKDEFIKVDSPNAYKFEAFIFDAFNFFDNMSILRGKREYDFAPVKNAKGEDSPETARKLYNDYYTK